MTNCRRKRFPTVEEKGKRRKKRELQEHGNKVREKEPLWGGNSSRSKNGRKPISDSWHSLPTGSRKKADVMWGGLVRRGKRPLNGGGNTPGPLHVPKFIGKKQISV